MMERASSLEDVLAGAEPLYRPWTRCATSEEAKLIMCLWRRRCACGASWWWIVYEDKCPRCRRKT